MVKIGHLSQHPRTLNRGRGGSVNKRKGKRREGRMDDTGKQREGGERLRDGGKRRKRREIRRKQ